MATLKFIREIKDTSLLLLGIVGEGESADYTVNSSLYAEIGSPAVGDEIDFASLSAIKHADEHYRAKKKALSILAYADNNKKNLKAKLLRAGFSYEISDHVCEEMVSYGYINENNQLERLIMIEANQKLRGPLRIVPALVNKGYSSSDVRRVLNRLVDEGEINFKKNSRRLAEKKLPDDFDEEDLKKLLYKNGFNL
jgi:SOS response regulatory protein OraA/RecX